MKEPSSVERLRCRLRSTTGQGINLMTRVGFAEDLAICWTLHRSLGVPYSDASWYALPAMWRILLSEGSMKLCLVEDRARPLGSRIVSFNAILFVTAEFCSQAQSTLPPYLGIELTRRFLSHQLPRMNREQIAWANASGGLNVLMCFEGWTRDGLLPEQVLALREKQNEALHLTLGGYRVKEFLVEQIGEENWQWMLDAGTRLRRDYSDCFRKGDVSEAESSQGPRLVGLTKEEAFAHPGSNIASLFIFSPPRFHFNRSQRLLLQQALMGKTSETLAKSLSISPWTVKKRWSAIYERVADVDSELLPAFIAYSAHASSRGAERRRRLLSYLRQHPEELRPCEPPDWMATHRRGDYR